MLKKFILNIKVKRAKQIRANKWKNSTAKDELITEEEDHTLSFSELIGFSEEEEKMMTTLEKIEKAKVLMEKMKDSKALLNEMKRTRALLLRSLRAVRALNSKIIEHNQEINK